VRDIIRELRERGTTVFLNSHLLGEVEATCSRVVFVKEGRAIHDMRVGESVGRFEVEVRTGPLSVEAREAISRIGRILDESPIVDGAAPARAKLRLEIAEESRLPELARTVVERGIPLYEMRAAHKSLEAWFLEVMGEDQRPG
jgi:ABC-2 type transport system ATP-binding protein